MSVISASRICKAKVVTVLLSTIALFGFSDAKKSQEQKHSSELVENHKVMLELNRYTSLKGWRANAYWIETEKSIVVIDLPLLPADAKQMVAAIKLANKPVQAAFITHPHPDHFAGLAVLKDAFGTMPVYSTKKTANAMEKAHSDFLNGGFSKPFGDGVETRFVGVSNPLKSKQSITIDQVVFMIDDLGAGEAENNAVVYVPSKKWLFSGDATMHNHHYFVGEGRSEAVINQFKYLKKQYSKSYVYSGHGEPASSAVFDAHINYVVQLRSLVGKALANKNNLMANKKHLSRESRREVVKELIKLNPHLGGYGLDKKQLVAMSVYGVEAEFFKKSKKSPVKSKRIVAKK